MKIWAITATIVAMIFLILWLIYRRQIQTICRQLAFIKKNDTNMVLYGDETFAELNQLKDEINEVLEQSKQIHRQTKRHEENFKETITNISHDIRTPLTSLDGYFQLLQQCESQEQRETYIAVIKERITSLSDMLEELFTYTKLQNAGYELELEEMDFGKCVFDTAFSFYEDFKAQGIEPEVDFAEGVYRIHANREAVRRILQNMIKNALEHGKHKICLKLYEENGMVVFCCANEVEDAENIDMEKIFERFYKADSARTHTSTGLGLSIAKNLAEKMDGTMEAQMEGDNFISSVAFSVRFINKTLPVCYETCRDYGTDSK